MRTIIVSLSKSDNFVYFALDQSDIDKGFVEYKVGKYSLKGVNTSLGGLKKFIKDNQLDWLTHYVVLPISTFTVAENVDKDLEYDMVTVKLPFRFIIRNPKRI